MKHLFILLLIILLACVGKSGWSFTSPVENVAISPAVEYESVIVFGDSICADVNRRRIQIRAWPTILEELSGVNVDSYCIPGIKLYEYDFEARFLESGIEYKYAVINLGVNDVISGKSLDATMKIYRSTLDYIESKGIEPVCFIYNNDREEILALSAAITKLCTQRKLSLIHSASQTVDGLHLTQMSQHDTAVDASHVLFPE